MPSVRRPRTTTALGRSRLLCALLIGPASSPAGASPGASAPSSRRAAAADVLAAEVLEAIETRPEFVPSCHDRGCEVKIGANLLSEADFDHDYKVCVADALLSDFDEALPSRTFSRRKHIADPYSVNIEGHVVIAKRGITGTSPLNHGAEVPSGTTTPERPKPDILLVADLVGGDELSRYRIQKISFESRLNDSEGSARPPPPTSTVASAGGAAHGATIVPLGTIELPELYLSDFPECARPVGASFEFTMWRGAGPPLPHPIYTATTGDQLRPHIQVESDSYVYLFTHLAAADQNGMGPVTVQIQQSWRGSRSNPDEFPTLSVPPGTSEATFFLLVTSDDQPLSDDLLRAIKLGSVVFVSDVERMLSSYVKQNSLGRELLQYKISFN